MNLHQELDRYLTIRRSLGYDLRTSERILRRLIAFAESQGADHISTDLFVKWQGVFDHASRQTWAARLCIVRLFAQWLHSLDPTHKIPPQGLIPNRSRRSRPYIYSEEEIGRIVAAAAALPSVYGMQAILHRSSLHPDGGKRQYDRRLPRHLPPAAPLRQDLDAELIGNFLLHVETTRRNGARSRNTRLSAIRSFFRFVAINEPVHLLHCQQILAMPDKRYVKRSVTFLDRDEIAALLAAPDRSTWTGRRDHAILLIALQTGLRASELINLRCPGCCSRQGCASALRWQGPEGALYAAAPRHGQCSGTLAQGAARVWGRSAVPVDAGRQVKPRRARASRPQAQSECRSLLSIARWQTRQSPRAQT